MAVWLYFHETVILPMPVFSCYNRHLIVKKILCILSRKSASNHKRGSGKLVDSILILKK